MDDLLSRFRPSPFVDPGGSVGAQMARQAGVPSDAGQGTMPAGYIDPGLVVKDDAGVSRVILGRISETPDYGLKVVSADGSTVIIDGTSDVFKIVATGTLSLVGPNGSPAQTIASVDVTTNLDHSPAFNSFIEANGSPTGTIFSTENLTLDSAGHVVQQKFCVTDYLSATQTRVRFFWNGIGNYSAITNYMRYYLFEEVGF